MTVAAFLRWVLTKPLVIVVVLACAVVGGLIGYRSATVQYETKAAVLVVPPSIPSVPGASDAMLNPFTNLSGSTTQLAWVLTSSAQSVQARQLVTEAGASADYTIASVAGDSSFSQLSPQITITVPATDPGAAEAGAQALITFMREHLRTIQKDAGVAPTVYAELRTTTEPTPGTQVGSTAVSNAGGLALGAALAGLILCMLVAAGLDARRRARAQAAEAEGEGAVALSPLSGIVAAVREAASGGSSSGKRGTSPAPASRAPGVVAGPSTAPTARLSITPPPADDDATRPDPPRPARPAGRARELAMTRWRDRVEVISEDSEFPLPTIDDDAEPPRRLGTSG